MVFILFFSQLYLIQDSSLTFQDFFFYIHLFSFHELPKSKSALYFNKYRPFSNNLTISFWVSYLLFNRLVKIYHLDKDAVVPVVGDTQIEAFGGFLLERCVGSWR